MDIAVQEAVLALNPWLSAPSCLAAELDRLLPDRLLQRPCIDSIRRVLDSGSFGAQVVVGPRQAGKSTAIRAALRRDPPATLLYLSCEEPLIIQWCQSPALFMRDVREWIGDSGVLFLDEAQHLDDAGLFIKGLVDQKWPWHVLVTGSSSFHLEARTRESLAGRAARHCVWPFSLAEVVHDRVAEAAPKVAVHAATVAVHDDAVLWGGYPAVATVANESRELVLRELREAFVMRDASDRFDVARPDAFRSLLRLVAGQVGDLVNQSEWSRVLGVSASTVADYINILEETHIIRLVRPFVGGKRAEITQTPKVYFVDNGLRNITAGGFAPIPVRTDTGRLFENWVFSELNKLCPEPGAIRYWRSRNGAELDFVLEPEAGTLVGVEVKATRRPKLTRGARSFVDAYAPRQLHVLCHGDPSVQCIGKTEIVTDHMATGLQRIVDRFSRSIS